LIFHADAFFFSLGGTRKISTSSDNPPNSV
jgi:hypothetical protein